MASIRLKDYLESLSTKGTISDNDLVPLLDSDSTNALKTTTKGTLTNLSSITGFNTFSSSVNSALDTLQFASSSNVSTSLEQSVDIAVLGAYTASQNTINTTNTNHRSAVNSYTGSQNTINTSVNSHILGVSNYTSSNNSVIANIQAYTSSLKGAIEISGQDVNILGMLTAQQFNITRVSSSVQFQSGSTEFGDTSDDTHTFTGTILLNGEAIGLSELNSYTSSQNTINTSVNSHILGVATQTGSQDLVNLGISTYTGSNELWKAGVRGEISGIEAWTASLDSTYATDAQLYQLYQATASVHSTTQSLNTQTGSQSNLNVQIGIATSSLNSVSASLIGITNGLMAFTASLDNTYATDAQLYQLYAETASIKAEIAGIEAYTASLKGQAIISSSQQITNLGFATTSSLIGSGLISSSTQLINLGFPTTSSSDTLSNKTLSNPLLGSFNITSDGLSKMGQYGNNVEFFSKDGFLLNPATDRAVYIDSYDNQNKVVINSDLAGYETNAKGIVSSSTQIQNYNVFAQTASVNTFYGDQTITGSLAIKDSETNFIIEGNGFSQTYLTSNGAIVLNPGYGGVEMVGSYKTFKADDITADGTLLVKGSTTLGDNGVDNTTITGSLNVTGSITLTSGSITMPHRPAFRLIGDGGQILAPYTISGSRVVMDYNQGNHYNPETGLFRAPIAGLYQVNLVVRTQSNTNSTINQAIVYKSGSNTGGDIAQIMVEYGINTTMNHTGGSTISYLDAGDTLKAVVAVGTCSFDSNDNLSVAYIG